MQEKHVAVEQYKTENGIQWEQYIQYRQINWVVEQSTSRDNQLTHKLLQ